jgi:uncharacterized protein DUF3305
MDARPSIALAVVMQRIAQPNRWEDWQHNVIEVTRDEGAYGPGPRKLHDDGRISQWLHPGFALELFADECKGYFLNLTSGRPTWFVPWRLDEGDASIARPQQVSVSYIEADRWMSADERVDSLPLPDEVCEWLRLFTNAHFRPDEARRVRAHSFLSPEERQKLVP